MQKYRYVEDDEKQRLITKKLLMKNNFDVIDVKNAVEGLEVLENEYIDIIISDYRMPEMNGYEFLENIKNINPYVKFILVTAYGNIDLAVNIIKMGAVDFLTKPFDFDELLKKIKSVIKDKLVGNELKKINKNNTQQSMQSHCYDGIIGKSKNFMELLSMIPRIAESDMPVLITGESGTGKELIADLVHKLSKRCDEKLVKINCSAIPENLIESELFGYNKGAFTGASSSKKGLIESADNGSIFLDEIGELNYSVQSKLLRFLQNSEINKIGNNKPISVNTRIISATNRDLEDEIKNKNFREDLYFRLNVIYLKLPPLRERKEDIPLLIEYFLNKYAGLKNNKTIMSPEAIDKLIKYNYPGNIRELENIIRNAMVISLDDRIEPEDIPVFNINEYDEDASSLDLPDKSLDINEYLFNIEKRLIEKALDKNHNSRVKTAKYLNITERVLRYKIDKFGIDK